MKPRNGLFLAAVALACCPAAQTIVHDATGIACSIVVQSTDPLLAPVCTTVDEIEAAIAALIAQHTAAHPGDAAYKPTQAELYAEIVKRHAAAGAK